MVKKIVKWFLIVVLAVLILLIALPFVFQGAIVDRIKHEVNEQLDARVDFGSYRLSLIRNFPDASLRIDDILVVNEAPFEGDTLASIGRLRVTIDLRSLFGDGFEIKHIQLSRPDLRFRLLEDGSANWDIVPPAEEAPEPAEASDFSLALRSIDIRDANILYHDDVFLTYVDVKGLTGRMRGDLTMDVTNLRTRNARIDAFSLRYDRMPILSNVGVDLTAEVEMDLRDWIFTFRENEITLNALPLAFDGVISIPEDGGTMMDFSFAAIRSDFAAFLSIIPAMYTDDFAALRTDGSLALQGSVNGLLKGEQIPGFDLMLKVDDGMFSYPDLPESVRDVNIDLHVANEGTGMDDVRINMPEFRFNMGGNPFDARFAMRDPISDPWIDLAMNLDLNLGEVMQFIPLEEDMALEGLMEAQLEARGRMSPKLLEGDQIPGFHLMLKLDDGMFRYPDLPESVRDVHIDLHVINEGTGKDDVRINIPEFRLNMGGNPFDARFAMRNPISDPWIDLAMNLDLNLGEVMQFIPLEEDMVLEGSTAAQIEARGRLSSIEKGDFQQFHATGSVQVRDIKADMNMLPAPFEMPYLESTFSPRYLSIDRMRAGIADNVLDVSGRVDNILHYVFEGDILKGNLSIASDYININQFMPDMPESAELQVRREDAPDLEAVRREAPGEMSVIAVPENVDFSLRANIRQLVFDDMDIRNLKGNVRIADRKALLNQLTMDLLGGSLTLNGSYDTRNEDPDVAFSLDLSGFDIQQTFHTFNTMEVLAPVGEYASGNISGGLTLNATLDQTMQPILESLSGNGNIRSRNVVVQNLPAMVRLSEHLEMDRFREFDVGNVSLRFTFADEKVETEPFEVTFGRSDAVISGVTWFDQRIDYVMRLGIPHEQFGERATRELDNLLEEAADRGFDIDPGDRVEIDVLITGTVTEPELSLDMTGAIDDVRDQIRDEVDRFLEETEDRIRDEADRAREQAEEEVRERIDETRDRVEEEVEERAQQVIAEAERQAENIRNEASRAADRIRREARERADRLVEEADGPIATAAARRAADSLVNEANRRADQLEEEADQRAQRIVDEAHEQAERIMRGEE